MYEFLHLISFLCCHVLIASTPATTIPTISGQRSAAISDSWHVKLNQKLAKGPISDDNDDDYEDYDQTEEDSVRHTSRQRFRFAQRNGTTYAWGRWEKWSKCNNSCVQIRRRKCLQRVQANNSEAIETEFYPDQMHRGGCFGIVRRYRHCKDAKCRSGNKQLRDQQCANFNKTPHRGKFHNWLGYEKEHNECELYCRPSDSDIFVSMNQSVIDGTPCEKPSIYYTHAYRMRAVCVEGLCRAVHSSGAIRPSTTNDSVIRCGSVLCQVVSELYSMPKPSYGYNYVATIPAGAMNLTIKHLTHSDNLLALKTLDDIFITNGNGNGRASESGIFEYNDDVYDYNRELSIITARGPLNRPVQLLLFVRGHNTGVKYDYTVPVPSAPVGGEDELPLQWDELGQPLSDDTTNNNNDENNLIDGAVSAQIARTKERKRRKFSWKLLGFGQCNRSCGPGIQQPIFRCTRESPTRYYSPKRCAFAKKPDFSEDIYHCNLKMCPAYWRPGNFSECLCEADIEAGLRTRRMQCVQEQSTGHIIVVDEKSCAGEKLPELSETCRCAPPAASSSLRRNIYARAPDKMPQVYARLIGSAAAAAAAVRVSRNATSPLRRHLRDDRVDKAGVWLMAEWSEQCIGRESRGGDCGTGVGYEHRSIYCDRTPPSTDLCDRRYTPQQKRTCGIASDQGKERAQEQCAQGVWFISEWSNCTGDCFSLQRRRAVLCVRSGGVVAEAACEGVPRPAEVANCTHKEVDYCAAKWHYSEWSECSRSCGEGIQRRYAKCLEYDWKQGALVESNNCKYLDREPVYGACNTQKCEEPKTPLETLMAATIERPEDCSDEFANCKRINRQRLCKLQYYKTYCCDTCSEEYGS